MKHPDSVRTLDAQTIFDNAFPATREPRSEAYKAGVLAAIRFRLGEQPGIEHPFQPGTAEADAFHSGIDEGHAIVRQALLEVRK